MPAYPEIVGWGRGVAAVALAIATTRAEGRTVLCFGDSTSLLYAARLQARRPGLLVVNGAKLGDVSSNLARLTTLLDAHRPDDVVIMIGTNDVVRRRDGRPVVTLDPRVTFRNVRALAARARAAGARVIVLTQTPAACAAGCAERQRHTRDVAHRLTAWGLRRPRLVRVADLRDEFTAWNWLAASNDGLHPNWSGAEVIARYVSDQLEDPRR